MRLSRAANLPLTAISGNRLLRTCGGGSRGFLLQLKSSPEVVAGYYSLGAASIEKRKLPVELAKRLPHYPVPAAILGRLAVDRKHHGLGLGEGLLLDAIRRVVHASDSIAIYALMVDVKKRTHPDILRTLWFPFFYQQGVCRISCLAVSWQAESGISTRLRATGHVCWLVLECLLIRLVPARKFAQPLLAARIPVYNIPILGVWSPICYNDATVLILSNRN